MIVESRADGADEVAAGISTGCCEEAVPDRFISLHREALAESVGGVRRIVRGDILLCCLLLALPSSQQMYVVTYRVHHGYCYGLVRVVG